MLLKSYVKTIKTNVLGHERDKHSLGALHSCEHAMAVFLNSCFE